MAHGNALEALFEASPAPLFLTELQTGRIVMANLAATQLFEFERVRLVGHTTTELGIWLSNDDRERAKKLLLETGSARDQQTRVRTATGRILHVVFTSNVLDWDGKPHLLTSYVDVSDRIRAEEELRRSEEKYRGIFDESVAAIFVLDGDRRFVDANQAGLELLGYSRDEMLSLRISDIDEDPEPRLRQLMSGGRLVDHEHRLRRKDGRVLTVLNNSRPLTNAEGRVTGMQSTLIDVTARRDAMHALERESQKNLALLRGASDGLHILDREGVVLEASDSFCASLGYARDELVGMNVRHWDGSFDDEQLPEKLGDLLNRPSRAPFETVHRRKDGSRLDVEISGFPVELAGRTVLFCSAREITARKRTETELRLSHSLLTASLESTADGLLAVSNDGRVSGFNRRFLQMWGIPDALAETGDDDRLLQFVLEQLEDPEAFLARVRELTVERSEVSWEELAFRDGRIFERYSQPQRLGDQVVGRVWSFRDVTQARRAEHALRESEQKYRELLNGMNESVWVLDFDASILDVNDTAAAQLGYSREELLSMRVPDIDKTLSPEHIAQLMKDLPNDRVQVFETQHLTKDGRALPVEISSSLVSYLGRQAILSIARDTTDRKRAAEALRQSEEKYRALVETTDTGLLILDREGLVLDANEEYARLAGYRHQSDVIGRSVLSWTAPHERERMVAALARCVRERAIRNFGVEYLGHDDHALPIEINATARGEGPSLEIVALCRDVSDRKRLELERLRTQKLESIGTLAGGIAHDFNNLLQCVLGGVSLARLECHEHSKALEGLEAAEKALDQSIRLSNQLLTFAKGGKPSIKSTDLRPVIANAASFALSGSRCTCEISADPDLRNVDADEGQIGQVIQNIVLNASQAMPDGGRVVVSARNVRLADGDHVEIAVHDAGVGIPAEQLGRIFDPYFSTKETGSGLGLATSYSIVTNHRGRIDVESVPGTGTTFRVHLPASTEVVREPPAPPRSAPTMKAARVLLMDDDEQVRNVAGKMLKRLGHDVTLVAHGEAALESFVEAENRGQPFDLVILDLVIKGGMGGEETAKRLHALAPDARLLLSSGYADSDAISEHRKHGFAAALNKPYTMQTLRECLSAVLDRT